MNSPRQARLACHAAAAFALAMGAAVPAAAAGGTCTQWQAPALMEVMQNGQGGQRVYFQLKQEGSVIHGWAQYQTTRKTVIGNFSGDITGNGFHARVLWTYSGQPSIGLYTGKIVPREGGTVGNTMYGYVLEGSTHDEYVNPPQYQYWNAYHFTCQLEPAPPAVQLGRVQATAATAATAPMSICDAARSAKARNSPVAPALERQCLAGGGSVAPPPLRAASRFDAIVQPYEAKLPSIVVDAAQVDALAAVGAAIADTDPAVAAARDGSMSEPYQRGFNIGTGLFGDPTRGATGNTAMGPGSLRIRAALDPAGQAGFDAAVAFHFARDYRR